MPWSAGPLQQGPETGPQSQKVWVMQVVFALPGVYFSILQSPLLCDYTIYFIHKCSSRMNRQHFPDQEGCGGRTTPNDLSGRDRSPEPTTPMSPTKTPTPSLSGCSTIHCLVRHHYNRLPHDLVKGVETERGAAVREMDSLGTRIV